MSPWRSDTSIPGFFSAKVTFWRVSKYCDLLKCLVLLQDASNKINKPKQNKNNGRRAFKIRYQIYDANLTHLSCQLSLQVQHLEHHDDINFGFEPIQVLYMEVVQVHGGIRPDIMEFKPGIFDIGNVKFE